MAYKFALIDLSNNYIEIKEIPIELIKNFLGGRGLNMFFLYKYLKPGVDPYDPDNPLVFGAGLLTGTNAPSASRFNVSGKSPETLFLGDANCGHFFGPRMKQAGFSNLIIIGKAKKPVYLLIDNEKIEILDAKNIWGNNTQKTQEILNIVHGKSIQVACIGKAGERLVRFASIVNGKKASAARTGMGALMGSKNLKAIVCVENHGGTVRRTPTDEQLNLTKELNKYLADSKIIQALGKYGTQLLYKPSNTIGAIRTKNAQLNTFSENLNAENFEPHIKRMSACYNCIVHCRHNNKQGGVGPDYSTVGILGANLGISDPEKIIELNNISNDLGLDTSSVGGIISWAIELYERGIIDKSLTGIELKFDDFDLIKKLIIDISEREDFGNILAESSFASKYFPENSRDYLIAIKNLPQSDPHDVRIIKSFALGIAVASRGADHLRNRPTLDFFSLPDNVREEIYGEKIDPNITSYNTKESTVYFHENIYSIIDSLGLCKFICHGFNSPKLLGYNHFSQLINLHTNLNLAKNDLFESAKLIIDTERLINMREGLTRADDTLPKRYFDDPITLKMYQGEKIDRKEFDNLLTKYYKKRAWNFDGVPTKERQEKLDCLCELI
jgi:aldehyde:ferredoxin oxidoreductase